MSGDCLTREAKILEHSSPDLDMEGLESCTLLHSFQYRLASYSTKICLLLTKSCLVIVVLEEKAEIRSLAIPNVLLTVCDRRSRRN